MPNINNNYRYYGNGYADPVLQTQYIDVNTKTYHTVNDFQIIQLFIQMTRRNHLIESTVSVRTKGCFTYISFITILLMAISNDVQLNPGPGPTNNDSTIYGCGTCTQPVTWDHRAVVCNTCDQWYHISCQEIQSGTYSILNEDDNICWNCINCNNPNYSTICYDLHHLATDNIYSILTLSDTSIQNPDICNTLLKPILASTPEKKILCKREVKISPLGILNINCQSIKKKQDRMENLIDSINPDIVIATETWLDPTITNNQVFHPTT